MGAVGATPLDHGLVHLDVVDEQVLDVQALHLQQDEHQHARGKDMTPTTEHAKNVCAKQGQAHYDISSLGHAKARSASRS